MSEGLELLPGMKILDFQGHLGGEIRISNRLSLLESERRNRIIGIRTLYSELCMEEIEFPSD